MDTSPVTLAAAADALGTSYEAIRKRIKRGTLQASKNEQGHWLVYLPSDTPPGHDDLSDIHKTAVRPASRCGKCMKLEAALSSMTVQVDALRVQVSALEIERDDWKQQAQHTIQALTNQQALALPGAMSDMGKLPSSTAPRGLWARLRDAIKQPKE